MQHDRGRSTALQRTQLLAGFTQGRRRPHHQRMAQGQAQVGGGKIGAAHDKDAPGEISPGPGTPEAGSPEAGSPGWAAKAR